MQVIKNNMDNKIKSLNTGKCPHCGEDILIEFDITPPAVLDVFTEDAVEKAKADVKEIVSKKVLPEEEKQKFLEWLSDEKTVFGPNDVDSVSNSV